MASNFMEFHTRVECWRVGVGGWRQKIISGRLEVGVLGSAPPLAAEATSLIQKETSGCGVSYVGSVNGEQ